VTTATARLDKLKARRAGIDPELDVHTERRLCADGMPTGSVLRLIGADAWSDKATARRI